MQQQMLDAFSAQQEVIKRVALLESGHQPAVPEASASQVGALCCVSMALLLELSQTKGLRPRLC